MRQLQPLPWALPESSREGEGGWRQPCATPGDGIVPHGKDNVCRWARHSNRNELALHSQNALRQGITVGIFRGRRIQLLCGYDLSVLQRHTMAICKPCQFRRPVSHSGAQHGIHAGGIGKGTLPSRQLEAVNKTRKRLRREIRIHQFQAAPGSIREAVPEGRKGTNTEGENLAVPASA